MHVKFSRAPNTSKKMLAEFFDDDGDLVRRVQFGAAGYEDYTTHRDDERRERYLTRHRNNENWKNPFTAGALSRWILWNKPTLAASIRDYKQRFGLDRRSR